MSTNLNTSLLKQISFDNQEVRTLLIDGTQIWLNHFEKHSYVVASENNRETKSSYIGPNYGPHPELTYEPLEPVPGFQFIYDQSGARYEIRNIHGSVYSSYSDEYKNDGKIASGHVFHLDQLVFFDDGENSVQTTIVSMSGSVVCLSEPLGNRLCIDLNNIPKNWYIDFPDGIDADLDGVDVSIDIDDNDPLIGRYAYVTIEPTTIDGYETINGELLATKGFLPNMLVKIQANPVEEKEFDSWITNDINLMPEEARNPLLEFPMPPRHVTITPSYVDIGGRQRRFLLDSSEQDTERGSIEDLKFGSYLPTEEVVVVATPKNGYKFTKWETENANVYEENNAQTKLIMPKSDVKLKAVFDPKDYIVNVKKPTGGSIKILPISNEDTIIISDPIEGVEPQENTVITTDPSITTDRPFKTVVSVVAEPNDQKTTFKEWNVTGVNITEEEKTEATLSFVQPSNEVEVFAVFESNEFTVQIDAGLSRNGIGYVGSNPASRSSVLPADSIVIVSANPVDSTYRFVGWSSDDVNFTNPSSQSTSFVMPRSNVLITFSFEKITSFLNLTVNDTSIGSVLGGGKFEAGDNVELKAYPKAGYEISEWRILTNGVSIPELSNPDRIVNFLMPNQDVNIEAFFEEAKYNLEVIYDETIPGMTVTGGGLKKYDEDVVVQVNNVPASYSFVKWIYSADGSEPIEFSSASFFPSLTIDMPPADVTLELVIDTPSFEVSSPTLIGGNIVGLGNYKALKDVKLSALASDGYDYVNDSWVFISGISQSDVTKSGEKKDVIEFTMPDVNVELSATFTARPFKVNFNDTSNSNISYVATSTPTSPKTGESVSINIAPAEGYKVALDSLKSDDVIFESSTISTATFIMPPKDVEIKFQLEGQVLDVNFLIDPTSSGGSGIIKGPSSAKVGDLITLTAQPNVGFVFTQWNVTGCLTLSDSQKTSQTITFVMPGCAFSIFAAFSAPIISFSASSAGVTFESVVGSTALVPDSIEQVDSATNKFNFSAQYPEKVEVTAVTTAELEVDPSTWSITSVDESAITYSTKYQKDDTIKFYLPTSSVEITVGSKARVNSVFLEEYSNNLDSHPLYNDELIVTDYTDWTGKWWRDGQGIRANEDVILNFAPKLQQYNFNGYLPNRFSNISSSDYLITDAEDGLFNVKKIQFKMPPGDVLIAADLKLNHCLYDVVERSPTFNFPHPNHYGIYSQGYMYLNHAWLTHKGRQYSTSEEGGGSPLKSSGWGLASYETPESQFPKSQVFFNDERLYRSDFNSIDEYSVKMYHEEFKFRYGINSGTVADISLPYESNEEQNKITLNSPGIFTLNMDFDSPYLGGGTFSNLSYNYSDAHQSLDIHVYDDDKFGAIYAQPTHGKTPTGDWYSYSEERDKYWPKGMLSKQKMAKYDTALDQSYFYNFSSTEAHYRMYESDAQVNSSHQPGHGQAEQFGCSDDGSVFFNVLSPYNNEEKDQVFRSFNADGDFPNTAVIIRVFTKVNERLTQGYIQREPDIIFDVNTNIDYFYDRGSAKVAISGDGKTIVVSHQNHRSTYSNSTAPGTTRVYRLRIDKVLEYGYEVTKYSWQQIGEDINSNYHRISKVAINGNGNVIAIQYAWNASYEYHDSDNTVKIYDYNQGTAANPGDGGDSFTERQSIIFRDLPDYLNDSAFSTHDYKNKSRPEIRRLPGVCNKLEFDYNGDTIVIGTPNAIKCGGSVYVLNCSGSSWSLKGSKLTGDELIPTPEPSGYFTAQSTSIKYDQFGSSVSLSRDGNTLAVGAPQLSALSYLSTSYEKAVVIKKEDLDKIFKPGIDINTQSKIYSSAPSAEVAQIQIVDNNGNRTYIEGAISRISGGNKKNLFPVLDDLDCLSINKSAMFNSSDIGYPGFYGEEFTDQWGDGPITSDCSGDDCLINLNDFAVPQKAGYVKIFSFENNDWVQKGSKITGKKIGDGFGYSVSINNEGTVLTVGAPLAYRYQKDYTTYLTTRIYTVPGASYLYHYDSTDSDWGMSCVPNTNTSSSCTLYSQGKNGLVHGNKGSQDYLAKNIKLDGTGTIFNLWMQGSLTHTGLASNIAISKNYFTSANEDFFKLKDSLPYYESDYKWATDFVNANVHSLQYNGWGHLAISEIKTGAAASFSQYIELESPKLKDVGTSFDLSPVAYNSADNSIAIDPKYELLFVSEYGNCLIEKKSSAGSVIDSIYSSNKEQAIILKDNEYVTIHGSEISIVRYSVRALLDTYEPQTRPDWLNYISRPIFRDTNFRGGWQQQFITWSQPLSDSLQVSDTLTLNASSSSGNVVYYMTGTDPSNSAIDVSDPNQKTRGGVIYYKVQTPSITFNKESLYSIFAYAPADMTYSSQETEIKSISVTDSVPRHKVVLRIANYYGEVSSLSELTPPPDSTTGGYASGTVVTAKMLAPEGLIINELAYVNGITEYEHPSVDTVIFTVLPSTSIRNGEPVPKTTEMVFRAVKAPSISWLKEYDPIMAGFDTIDLMGDILDTDTGEFFADSIGLYSSDTSIATVTNSRQWNTRTGKYDYIRKINPLSEGTVTINLYDSNFPDFKIEKTITVLPFSYTDFSFPAMTNPEIYIMRSPEWWNGESWCVPDTTYYNNKSELPFEERYIIEKVDKIFYAKDVMFGINTYLGGVQAGVDLYYIGNQTITDRLIPRNFDVIPEDYVTGTSTSNGYYEGAKNGFVSSRNDIDDVWSVESYDPTSHTNKRWHSFFFLKPYHTDGRGNTGNPSANACANFDKIVNTWNGISYQDPNVEEQYQIFEILPSAPWNYAEIDDGSNDNFYDKMKEINSFNLSIVKRADKKYGEIETLSNTSFEIEEKFVIELSGLVDNKTHYWNWDPLPGALQVHGHDYITTDKRLGGSMKIIYSPNTPVSILWPKAIRHGSRGSIVPTNEYNFSEWLIALAYNQYHGIMAHQTEITTEQQAFIDSLLTSGSNSKTESSLEITTPDYMSGLTIRLKAQFLS